MKQALPGRLAEAVREPAWWLRLALVVGALLAAILIGLRPNSQLVQLAALLAAAAAGWLALNRYPAASLVALVPLAFLADWQLGTGTNVALNATFLMSMALVGAWLARMFIVERRLHLEPTPANAPALLFLLAVSLAWAASFLPWLPEAGEKPSLPAQLGAYLLYVLPVAACLLAANTLDTSRWVRRLTWVFLGCAAVYLLFQVIPWSAEPVKRFFVDAPTGHAVYWALLVSLSLGQALFNRELRSYVRLGLAGTALLAFAFILATRPQWLAGWLSALIAIFSLLWLWDWRLGALVGLPGLALVWMNFGRLYDYFFSETQAWSTLTRVVTWPIVWELFKVNPLSGLGPANYHYYVSNYSYFGYFLRFNTHNNYFDILLQAGAIGLLSFLALAGAIFVSGWRLRRASQDGFTRGYANGMCAALAAVLASGFMADYFLPFVYNVGVYGFQTSVFFWLFAGGLLSLYAIEKKKDA